MVPQPFVAADFEMTLGQELGYLDLIERVLASRNHVVNSAVQTSTQPKPNRHPFEHRVDKMKPSKT